MAARDGFAPGESLHLIAVCRVEQGLAVENLGGVAVDQAVHLHIDLALCRCRIHARHLRQETDVIVDVRLTAHGELSAVGVDLALRQQMSVRLSRRLELTVLAYQFKCAAADDVVVIRRCLEVGYRPLGAPLLERGRHPVVQLHDVLAEWFRPEWPGTLRSG